MRVELPEIPDKMIVRTYKRMWPEPDRPLFVTSEPIDTTYLSAKAVDEWLKTTGSADMSPRTRKLLRDGFRRHLKEIQDA